MSPIAPELGRWYVTMAGRIGASVNKPIYSIITCVSNFDIYNECVVNSFYNSKINKEHYELIPIDNRMSIYTAPQALNYGLIIAKSDLIICCHQDISFLPGFFDEVEKSVKKTGGDWGIIGSSGRSIEIDEVSKKPDWVGVVYNGHPNQLGDDFDNKLTKCWDGKKEMKEVHCVDECLFMINKRHNITFNPEINGFHFYGADLALSMRSAGHKVYATYLPSIHHGAYSGSLKAKDDYWPLFRKLLDMWSTIFPECYGTHFHWTTSEVGMEIASYISIESDTESFRASTTNIKIRENRK